MAALAAFFISPAAQAQMPLCTDRLEVVSQLSSQYAETPKAMGIANNGGVVEVLTSENGTWTIILTMPNNTTCMIAAGEGWEFFPKQLKGPKT